ncbi:transposase [Enterococcus sp. DIV0691]
MIFDRYAELKYRYGNRKFWCRGYYVDTVGRNKKKIAEYIRNQLREDHVADQLTLFEAVIRLLEKKIVRSIKSFFEKQRVNVVLIFS